MKGAKRQRAVTGGALGDGVAPFLGAPGRRSDGCLSVRAVFVGLERERSTMPVDSTAVRGWSFAAERCWGAGIKFYLSTRALPSHGSASHAWKLSSVVQRVIGSQC